MSKESKKTSLKSRNLAFLIFLVVLVLIFYGMGMIRLKGF
jgi:hypothetical protein